jgi:formylglycine-generating enzyme required for sulfatase activity
MKQMQILWLLAVLILTVAALVQGDPGASASQAQQQPAARVVGKTPAAGAKKVNAKDGLTYIWIPAGTFTMGCSPGDNECFDDEKPAHEVTISRGFWIGQTLVTQAAYKRVVGANPSRFKGEQLPVETVSWNDAQSYCRTVGMRLPTEGTWTPLRGIPTTAARNASTVGHCSKATLRTMKTT